MFRTWWLLLSFYHVPSWRSAGSVCCSARRGRSPGPAQSDRDGERADLPPAGLGKASGPRPRSRPSRRCLCLCLCLCFFFFFLCSWWWWWWCSLCLEDAGSFPNTDSGAAAAACTLISRGGCSLPVPFRGSSIFHWGFVVGVPSQPAECWGIRADRELAGRYLESPGVDGLSSMFKWWEMNAWLSWTVSISISSSSWELENYNTNKTKEERSHCFTLCLDFCSQERQQKSRRI